ncbi:MAG TPA: 3-carboxy-cis,cis-muconate cycloisomerase [Myxococcales bacterium]|nr:3-carboxy-cis,cis-muconate cycloisomerase [Myxococcales bacterium]
MPSSRLLRKLFSVPWAEECLGDLARLQGMLDFEAALARAEARVGLVPADAAEAIAQKCRAGLFDLDRLAEAAARAGNPAIPLVSALTALVAAENAGAARYVHLGATSQDAMDTGLVLQLRRLCEGLSGDLGRLSAALGRLAAAHRETVLAGRTWLQQAPPVTFGLKAAGWLDAVGRHAARLFDLMPRTLVLQFGGASGTLASLGGRGLEVAEALSRELRLPMPALPWHAHRDRLAELGAFLGILAGTLGKMGRDVSLLMQTEVSEAFEPAGEGRGVSSAMPQKRNPVSSAVALAAAARAPGLVATLLSAMAQEHERGLGGWQAEWETLPELGGLAAGSLAAMAEAMEGLEVDPERMRRNLAARGGVALAEAASSALAQRIGRPQATRIVARASRRALETERTLLETLCADPAVTEHLSPADLAVILEPRAYLGVASSFIDRVLAAGKEDH